MRRLRAVAWKQWKHGRARFAELRRQGVGRDLAAQTAGRPHGPWRLSNSPTLSLSLPNAYFRSLGLPSIAERRQRIIHRTAGYGPVCPVVLEGRSRKAPPIPIEDYRALAARLRQLANSHMLHKLTGLAAWGLLAFIAYATISPIQDRPTLAVSTSFEHLAAFAALGVMFSLTYPRQVVLVCLIVIGSAVLLEILQLLTPDRHGRVPDAIEKIAGGIVGIVVGYAILYFDQANRWFQN